MPASLRDILRLAFFALTTMSLATACTKTNHTGSHDVGGHERPTESQRDDDRRNSSDNKIDSSDNDAGVNSDNSDDRQDNNDVVDPYPNSDDPRDQQTNNQAGNDELRQDQEPQTTDSSVDEPVETSPVADNRTTFNLGDLVVTMPSGWTLHQEAIVGGTKFLGFARGNDYVRLYKSADRRSLNQIFGSSGASNTVGNFDWEFATTSGSRQSVAGFGGDQNGTFYFGFGKSGSSSTAKEALMSFLEALQ